MIGVVVVGDVSIGVGGGVVVGGVSCGGVGVVVSVTRSSLTCM